MDQQTVIVAVRAGGVGTRLWPVSRKKSPKQLHALIGEKSMLELTLDRARQIVPETNIVVTVNAELESAVRAVLPPGLQGNVFVEPVRRDTAAALGLEAVMIAHRWPGATIIGMPADALIIDEQTFTRILQTMIWGIEQHPDALFCVGAKPTFAHTGLGYIKIADVVGERNDVQIYRIDQFVEKPKKEIAESYLQDASYLWNANFFSWKATTVLSLYDRFLPEMKTGLDEISRALGTSQAADVLQNVFPTLEKIAFDYAIMEKAPIRYVVPADVGWSDIGDWSALRDVVIAGGKSNHVQGRHVSIDTERCLIHVPKDKVVATIGVSDLVIVDTGDALLICPATRAQEVKSIVSSLDSSGIEELL